MKKLANVFLFILLTSYLSREMRSIFHWDYLLPTSLYAQPGWSEDRRLVFLPGGGWYPRAACWGDTIHLVWYQRYPVHEEICYKRSTDAGLTWGDDVLLSEEDTQSSVLPQIAVSDNTVHVIWFEDDYGLLYCRSTDGGDTWASIDSIVPGMTYSSICAIGDTVYIAGTIGSLGVLRFTKSYDGGNTWQPIIEITSASSSPRIHSISDDVFNLIIAYAKSGSPVCTEVFQVLSYDGGQTWLDSTMVSQNDSVAGQRPAMVTDDSTGIHITWYDYKYSPYAWTGDIFYRASRDSGSTWEEIDSLTVMHRAVASDILAEGSNLHLVWEDDRHGFNNNFEIYYRMSTDLGETWGSEVRLTDALYHSYCPSLACGSGYLHLFWRDCRDSANNGIGFIYYKRKDLSSAVSENSNSGLSKHLIILPNPFRSKTIISFFLPEASGILEVFNAIGQRVLIEELLGRGRKEVIWQTNNAGVYFVRLKTKNKVVIKKMVKVE